MQTGLSRTLTVATAALLPLMTLLVVESYMRQHAPRWIKIVIAGGGALFAIAAINAELTRSNEFANLLLIYQLASFAILVWLVFGRDKSMVRHRLSAYYSYAVIGIRLSVHSQPAAKNDVRFCDLDWLLDTAASAC